VAEEEKEEERGQIVYRRMRKEEHSETLIEGEVENTESINDFLGPKSKFLGMT
jgi:hypothetical protein